MFKYLFPRYYLKQLEDAEILTMEGKLELCKVIDVYDGDTITIIFPFNKKYYKKRLRLAGIDTPEIKTKNDQEKMNGIFVKEWLENRILNSIVYIHFTKEDKYGRLMGWIYENRNSKNTVNNLMIQSNLAFPYNGGKKL